MPVLKEITKVSPAAAAALEKAGFVSDTDIRSLTRQDLYELIPGTQHIRVRKTIGDIIQNVKPINAVLKELLDSIPDDCVKEVLTNNCFLDDYLVNLGDMITKVESVDSFLKEHIVLFEEKQKKGSVTAQSTVRVKVIVQGQTFGCHSTLLQSVRELGDLHVHETDSDPEVIIVFYPLKKRHMTDILNPREVQEGKSKTLEPETLTSPIYPLRAVHEVGKRGIGAQEAKAAMKDVVTVIFRKTHQMTDIDIEVAMKDVVPGGAAVILVVMHHTHKVNYPHVWSLGSDRSLDLVNVLYHQTEPGMLTCASNKQAVAQLRGTLLMHSSAVSPVAVSRNVPVRVQEIRRVRVKVIVKGQTFGCHRTLLQRVRQQNGLHVDEADSGPKVVIVFCAVISRYMTDIEAAMKDVVPGGAAVILVLMHHTHDVDCVMKSLGSDRRWDLSVNVLYHETNGLLTCTSNDQAVAQLQGALLEHSSVVSPVAVSTRSTVRAKVIVKGETFDCHRTLLQHLTQLGGLHVDETYSVPKVVIVFYSLKTCRLEDIKSAMKDAVPGSGTRGILVVMHHTRDVNYRDVQSLGSDYSWDFVNVLYHETAGLLTCAFNEQAVAQLRGALLKHSSVVRHVAATAAAAQCVLR